MGDVLFMNETKGYVSINKLRIAGAQGPGSRYVAHHRRPIVTPQSTNRLLFHRKRHKPTHQMTSRSVRIGCTYPRDTGVGTLQHTEQASEADWSPEYEWSCALPGRGCQRKTPRVLKATSYPQIQVVRHGGSRRTDARWGGAAANRGPFPQRVGRLPKHGSREKALTSTVS